MLNELSSLDFDVLCDTRGLKCPMPVLKSKKKLISLNQGQKLCLISTDQMSVIDVPFMCREQGWVLEHQQSADDMNIFIILKP